MDYQNEIVATIIFVVAVRLGYDLYRDLVFYSANNWDFELDTARSGKFFEGPFYGRWKGRRKLDNKSRVIFAQPVLTLVFFAMSILVYLFL